MKNRANALADRLEQGASALATFASALTDAEWHTRLPRDGRKVGVVVHHVATMYPLEIQLAQTLAAGKPVTGVTWDVVHELNARHAREYDAVTKEETLDLLGKNSTAAAASIRALSDEELDRTAPVSLYSDAPLTCQFVLEDHAVRHSYHHLARIRGALKKQAATTNDDGRSPWRSAAGLEPRSERLCGFDRPRRGSPGQVPFVVTNDLNRRCGAGDIERNGCVSYRSRPPVAPSLPAGGWLLSLHVNPGAAPGKP